MWTSDTENNTNTNQENNTITLENHLDSFVTSNKDEQSKIINARENTETIHSNLNVTPHQLTNNSNTNIFSELQNEPENGSVQNGNTLLTPQKQNNDEMNLNDSLEDSNDLNYSKSKSYYVSDFPLSSMKKDNCKESTSSLQEKDQSNTNSITTQNQNMDNIYKKLIINKRLNVYNNKLSYHCKGNESLNHPTTIINNTCIHNSERNNTNNSMANNINKLTSYLNSTGNNGINNLTDLEINPYSTAKNNKLSEMNNYYSKFSTQPQSGRIFSSLRSGKKFQSQNYDSGYCENSSYGKVSEFTIQKVLPKNNGEVEQNEEEINKLKKWLQSIELPAQYINIFIENNLTNLKLLVNSMKSYETKFKYEDLEALGIKRPGHIYRILTRLEIDCGLIDNKITQFILPPGTYGISNALEASNFNVNRLNLKISNEYCCGCYRTKALETKNDLKLWMRKNNILSLFPNFAHNGFDNFEYIILQMYSAYPINDDILENCFHIYDEDERKHVMLCFIREMKKINLFINSKEYIDNPLKFKYSNLQLEQEDSNEDKGVDHCNACNIF